MTERHKHAALSNLNVLDDELRIGGITLSQLAAQVGRTPFYAYDREAMRLRVQKLRDAMPQEISIHYAVKANPMPAVVAHMSSLIDGLDIASVGELSVALDAGMDPAKISFAGPGKRDPELRAAATEGVTLNLESPGELERLAIQAEQLGVRPRVAVRVNPDFELKSAGMRMGGGPKQFGIDVEAVPVVLRRIGELDLQFRGFHIYCGSQNLRAESLITAQKVTFELAYRLADNTPGPIELLNIGGGYGIPYFPGEQPLDLAPISEALQSRVDECRERLGETEIVLELGRYLVGEAGYYVCRVIDRKVSRGHTFLIMDGGLHHHLAASGNFGQVIRRNYPLVAGTRVFAGERETVSVVGPLCTPLDLLGDKVELGKVEVGDLIVVLQSGAYGFTASPQAFLNHPEPGELLI